MSLPMHTYLSRRDQNHVVEEVRMALSMCNESVMIKMIIYFLYLSVQTAVNGILFFPAFVERVEN